MKPSIGRIVIYQHPGSADGKYPAVQSPAIIQAVNEDGTLRLWVFGPWGQHLNPSCSAGGPDADMPTPSCWTWPARV